MLFKKLHIVLSIAVLVGAYCNIPLLEAKSQPFSVEISFSRSEPLEGEDTRVYVHIVNNDVDNRGVVRVFDDSKQIGPDTSFSALKGKTADTYADYTKLPYGERNITVKVFPFGTNASSSAVTQVLFVDRDTDKDGIPDKKDPDDDNDGVLDTADAFPLDKKESLDTDKDGAGDNADPDDDNDGLTDEQEKKIGSDPKKPDTDGDGVVDGKDAFPLDPKESLDTDRDGIGNNADLDDDNDGVPDASDALPLDPTDSRDTDHDGIGDKADTDIDGDGLSNIAEKELGTDPYKSDTDGDGVDDSHDAFPLNPAESKDTDHDGLGDNADPNNANKGPILKYDIPKSATLFIPYHFDAEGSSDPDGKIDKLAWTVDGVEKDGQSFWYFFVLPGNHEVTLLATDNSGESRSVVEMIWVSPALYIFILIIGGIGYLVFLKTHAKK